MCASLERIKAANDLALFDLMSVAHGGDQNSRTEFREALRERMGTTSRVSRPPSSPDQIMAAIVPL